MYGYLFCKHYINVKKTRYSTECLVFLYMSGYCCHKKSCSCINALDRTFFTILCAFFCAFFQKSFLHKTCRKGLDRLLRRLTARINARHSKLKTVHRTVFLTLWPLSGSSPYNPNKKITDTQKRIGYFGALEGTRTPDLLVRRDTRIAEWHSISW